MQIRNSRIYWLSAPEHSTHKNPRSRSTYSIQTRPMRSISKVDRDGFATEPGINQLRAKTDMYLRLHRTDYSIARGTGTHFVNIRKETSLITPRDLLFLTLHPPLLFFSRVISSPFHAGNM